MVTASYFGARAFVQEQTPVGKQFLQGYRDALFLLDSNAWVSPRALGAFRQHVLDMGFLSDGPRKIVEGSPSPSYHEMLASYEDYVKLLETMIERIGQAEKRMVEEIHRPGSSEPPPATIHSGKRTAARKQRKAKRKGTAPRKPKKKRK